MFVEVWVHTTPPGKRRDFIEVMKSAAQFFKSRGIKSRVLLKDSGPMDKIYLESDFESREAMREWYKTHMGTDEWVALIKELTEIGLYPNKAERHFYHEPPE